MKNLLLLCLAFFALPMIGLSQWTNNGTGTSTSFLNTQVRDGRTGVGFSDGFTCDAAAGTSNARLIVQNGNIGHFVNGAIGG
ncbi:MAG: hypothetical protein ACOYPR_20895, partial [Saprospiraceae bacterium]